MYCLFFSLKVLSEVCQLYWYLQRHCLFHRFSIVFLVLILLISTLIITVFFHQIALNLFFSSSGFRFLRCDCRLLNWYFTFFSNVSIYHYEFSSQHCFGCLSQIFVSFNSMHFSLSHDILSLIPGLFISDAVSCATENGAKLVGTVNAVYGLEPLFFPWLGTIVWSWMSCLAYFLRLFLYRMVTFLFEGFLGRKHKNLN